jgi:hypothetical protein
MMMVAASVLLEKKEEGNTLKAIYTCLNLFFSSLFMRKSIMGASLLPLQAEGSS